MGMRSFTVYLGMLDRASLHIRSQFWMWALVFGLTKCRLWLTVRCLYPLRPRLLYAAQPSDIITLPGRTNLSIISTRVGASRRSTGSKKKRLLADPRSTPPNTHWTSCCCPSLSFCFPKTISSTSTIFPGPPTQALRWAFHLQHTCL